MIWLRLIPYAPSGLAVAAVWALWADRADLKEQNAHLQREIAVQAEVAAQAALARDVAEAEAKRHRLRAEEYDALRESLLKGDNNATLPDWFIAYLERLFGANGHAPENPGSPGEAADAVPSSGAPLRHPE